jgi:hypothetical protein
MEFRCQEFVEEMIYGHLRREQLVKRWEGRTIVIDITRKVPKSEEELYEKHYLPPRWRPGASR